MGLALVGVAAAALTLGRKAERHDQRINDGQCGAEPLTQAALPAGFSDVGDTGYFALCEKDAAANAVRLGKPSDPIKMFGDPDGARLIGEWYGECGYPEGLVHPGDDRPACAAMGTTEP